MKLLRVNFYQAVSLPIRTKSNYNTVNEEAVPGVMLSVENQFVIVEHKDWSIAVVVPTANVRSMETAAIPIEEPMIEENQLSIVEPTPKKKRAK